MMVVVFRRRRWRRGWRRRCGMMLVNYGTVMYGAAFVYNRLTMYGAAFMNHGFAVMYGIALVYSRAVMHGAALMHYRSVVA